MERRLLCRLCGAVWVIFCVSWGLLPYVAGLRPRGLTVTGGWRGLGGLQPTNSKSVATINDRTAFSGFLTSSSGAEDRRKGMNNLPYWLTPSLVSQLHAVDTQTFPLSAVKPSPPLKRHPSLKRGFLSNGLEYIILPHDQSAGRFEAHLEILSGSAHELDHQQGMAHLLEHIAYMGSPGRMRIAGTGSRTNAYTDFHQTVFFAACPTTFTPVSDGAPVPLLPLALTALRDVFETKVSTTRLEQERAAVLSEATMVTKMEYRVECQILGTLHRENRLSRRFPIGQENLIRNWSSEDVQEFHRTHYRPDNAILYLVGDIDSETVVDQIELVFGDLSTQTNVKDIPLQNSDFPTESLSHVSRHFPPVVHRWSLAKNNSLLEKLPLSLQMTCGDDKSSSPGKSLSAASRVFSHDLLQNFSFHLLSKFPIEPVIDEASLRRSLLRRMVVLALQMRLNVQKSRPTRSLIDSNPNGKDSPPSSSLEKPGFSFVDFSSIDWPRDGCNVCTLDLVAEPTNWESAVSSAVVEIARLGRHGLMSGEFLRFREALRSDYFQASLLGAQQPTDELLAELQFHTACGHEQMDAKEKHEVVSRLLDEVTLNDVNDMAREICGPISHLDPKCGPFPSGLVACMPGGKESQTPIDEAKVAEVVLHALSEPLAPLQDTVVPGSLLSEDDRKTLLKNGSLRWTHIPTTEELSKGRFSSIFQGETSNGARFNVKSTSREPNRVALRAYFPSGRLSEKKHWMSETDDGFPVGSVLVGARAVQEGAAYRQWTREQLELFCVDRFVSVEVSVTDEAMIIDILATNSPPRESDNNSTTVSSVEAAFQVLHALLTELQVDARGFSHGLSLVADQFSGVTKALEPRTLETLIRHSTNGDERLLTPNSTVLSELTLSQVQDAMRSILTPGNLELSIVGDLSTDSAEQLLRTYVAPIPTSPSTFPTMIQKKLQEPISLNCPSKTYQMGSNASKSPLRVQLVDSEERSTAFLLGPSPNRYGVFPDGRKLGDLVQELDRDSPLKWLTGRSSSISENSDIRKHPLFGVVALTVASEFLNRRLFSEVRESRRLAYDAAFQIPSHDILPGGWWLVSVTSAPETVDAAVVAAQNALTTVSNSHIVTPLAVEACKRTVAARLAAEDSFLRFWLEQSSALQQGAYGREREAMDAFSTLLNALSARDVELTLRAMALNPQSMNACIGVTSPLLENK